MKGKDQHIPTVMPTTNRPRNAGGSINDDTSRLDSVAKVTGKAMFGRDRYLPTGLFVGFVRCPWGAAELASADTQAAQAVPGVLEVQVTGDKGQYHGQSIGYVVAESKPAMTRGLAALACEWRRSGVKTRIEDDLTPAPEPSDATKAVLAKAEHVLETVYSTSVQTHSTLETHGAVVDHRGESATIYASTQGTFSVRDGLDEALGLPRSQFEVICEYVGGGFGSKLGGPGKEGVTAARVAAKYKRPVYLFLNRAEDHLDGGNRPSSRTMVKIGFNKDGTILGGQVHTWGGTGVAGGGGGCSCPSGRYNLGPIQKGHNDARFNGGAPRAFRAPGSPQGAFAEELMLDEIATMAGLDPVALRLKIERDGDRREMLQLGAELIGWKDRQRTGSQKGVVRRGFGCGTASWGRFPAQSEAEVVINRDGSVEARTGTQDIGTGQRTVMGVVAADALGIPLRLITVRIGSSSLPIGPGSGGSVTTNNTAPAMAEAGRDALAKLLTMIAGQASADASEFGVAEGRVLRHNEPYLEWNEACAKIAGDSIIGRGSWNKDKQDADPTKGHSHGAQFVDLDVDAETGVIRLRRIVAIQACGRAVTRKGAESQIIGGVIQGISFALFENKILDRAVGAMVNADLEWYKIAGSADMPHIEPVLWTKNQTGARPLGEPPTIPTSGAIACAVFNAIGAPVRSLPITPDKVLAALEGGAG